MSGKSNPNEEVSCSAWFEINPIISQPYYGTLLYGVEIPQTPNGFKVTAENVESLDVSIKMGFWVTISGTPDYSGNAAVSKSNVPEGTYDIKIGGKIKDDSKPVILKIYASTVINADENGDFEYHYNTDAIDEGTTIYLNIGGVSKEVTITGSTPAPVVTSATTNTDNTTTTNTTTEDKSPPVIKVLAPSNSEYSTKSLDFDVDVTDDSEFEFFIYLNNNELDYENAGDHYTGSFELLNGKNELKLVSEDEYDNKNIKILYLTYSKPSEEISSETSEVSNVQESTETSGCSESTISEENVELNIVQGTMILNAGNALLTVNDGTEISTNGDIKIEEIQIPETALSYVIYPENTEFSDPLSLEIELSDVSGNLKVIYYDSKKGWINVPYNVEDNTLKLDVTKSGYYAVKVTETTTEEKDSFIDTIKSVLNAVKIIINAIFSRI